MKRETSIKIAKIILMTISAAGFLSVALMAPNALRAIEMFYGGNKKYNRKYHIKNTITKLKQGGFIEFKNRNGKSFIRLTEKGHQRLLKYQLHDFVIKKPKKWDNKWRVIIFDIKEYKRGIRNNLRKELVNLGFVRLQNSVWAYPYECEDLMFMLKTYFHLGKDVLYMTVDKIENDKWLREEFSLT